MYLNTCRKNLFNSLHVPLAQLEGNIALSGCNHRAIEERKHCDDTTYHVVESIIYNAQCVEHNTTGEELYHHN